MEKIISICVITRDGSILQDVDTTLFWSPADAKQYIVEMLASLVRSQSMQGSELNVVAFFMNVPEGDLSKWLADVGQEAALAWIIEHNDMETLAMFYETLREDTVDIRFATHINPNK